MTDTNNFFNMINNAVLKLQKERNELQDWIITQGNTNTSPNVINAVQGRIDSIDNMIGKFQEFQLLASDVDF